MITIFSLKKNSYSFTEDEKIILIKLLKFFAEEIPYEHGKFLSTLNLYKIDFKWAPEMTIGDDGVFGSWSISMPNTVLIRANEYSGSFYEMISSDAYKNINEKKKEIIECHKKTYNRFKEYENKLNRQSEFNEELLTFIFYLCENQGMILSTIFHELYHKFQFNKLKFLFILNQAFFSLLGYDFSSECKYSIEGDVRIKIDNVILYNKISLLYSILSGYYRKYKNNEEIQIPITDENSHFFTFAENLFEYARVHKQE